MATTTPTSNVLTCLWDQPTELGQTLDLLSAYGVQGPERLPMGEIDRLLLRLHRKVCGSDLEFTSRCPGCNAQNAFVLAAELLPPAQPAWVRVGTGGGVRPPAVVDLVDLPLDLDAAPLAVLERCTVGSPSEPATAVHLALAVSLDEVGPLGLECVDCGRPFEAAVDLGRAVLGAMVARATELDREVHLIATTYGWSLAEIESLPDGRREHLVGLIRGER